MAWYCVILNGKGISIPYGEGKDAVGFVATRAVKAPSVEEAVEKAKRIVESGWANPRFAPWNAKASPQLNTENVEEISWWQAFKLRKKGYIFYGENSGA